MPKRWGAPGICEGGSAIAAHLRAPSFLTAIQPVNEEKVSDDNTKHAHNDQHQA